MPKTRKNILFTLSKLTAVLQM